MAKNVVQPDTSFSEEVNRFVADHWTAAGAARESRWRSAVIDRGWHLPHWPERCGGPGWTPTQRYIWAKTLAEAGAPDCQTTGTLVIGPLLFDAAPLNTPRADRCAHWLDELRAGIDRWMLLVHEPGWDFQVPHLTTRAEEDAGLSGIKLVPDTTTEPGRCCVLALRRDEAVWCFVQPDSPGMAFEGGEITFDTTPAELMVPLAAAAQADLVRLLPEQVLYRSFELEGQLRALRETLAGQDFGEEAHDLERSLAEISVGTAALAAMEVRYLTALEQGTDLPFPPAALKVRARELSIELGDLQLRTFGYYALPYPDPMLSHNEGPVGPGLAGGTDGGINADMRDVLGRIAGDLHEEALSESLHVETLQIKDAMARDLEF